MGIRATQAEVARELGVKRQAVHSLVSRGILSIGDDGKLDLDVVRSIVAGMNPAKSKAAAKMAGVALLPAPAAPTPNGAAAAPPEGSSSGVTVEGPITSYHLARTLAEKYRALNQKAEYDERMGRLVDAQDVRREAFARARAARDALMALPARLAAQLAAESSSARCHELMAAEIRRICEDLAASTTAGDASRG